jgi:hypothetical protein
MERIEIIIQGSSKVDKYILYKSIHESFEKLGFFKVDLNPTPSMGMPNRSILYGKEINLDLYTLDLDQGQE